MKKPSIKQKRLFWLVILLLTGAPFIFSCSHEPSGISSLPTVCFESDVLPILSANCTYSGCHGADAERIRLTDYASVMRYVSPNSLKNSRLYTAITATFSNIMPPKSHRQLTVAERQTIEVWIEQGAQNTTCK